MPREFPQVDLKNTATNALSITNEDSRLLFSSKLKQLNLEFLERYTSSAKENDKSAAQFESLLNFILLFYKCFARG